MNCSSEIEEYINTLPKLNLKPVQPKIPQFKIKEMDCLMEKFSTKDEAARIAAIKHGFRDEYSGVEAGP